MSYILKRADTFGAWYLRKKHPYDFGIVWTDSILDSRRFRTKKEATDFANRVTAPYFATVVEQFNRDVKKSN